MKIKNLTQLLSAIQTISRTRIKHRLKIEKNIKTTFDPVRRLVGHWDDKMFHNVVDKQVVDTVQWL